MQIINNEYMSQSKEIRQDHLDLEDKCIERILQTQYQKSGYSYYLKGLLAHILNTNIPVRKDKDGVRVLLAHACNNAKCANPKHLYWATDKENIEDSGSFYERTLKKNGKQFIIDTNRRIAKELGTEHFSKMGKLGKGKNKSIEHRKNLSIAIKKWHKENGKI